MKRHLYALPAAGAAPLAIPATIQLRLVTLQEDDATPNQGLVVFFPEDNFTQGYTYAAGHEPIQRGNPVSRGRGRGPVLGHPIQKDASGTVVLRQADVLFKVTSATATATNVRVEETE